MIDVGGTPVVASASGEGMGGFGGIGFLGGLIFGDLLWGRQNEALNGLALGQAGLTSAIDSAKYDLTVNMNAGFAAIQNQMVQDELREAYAKINEQGQMLSEQRIIGAVTNSLQPPRPIPAYDVPNPYTGSYYGC